MRTWVKVVGAVYLLTGAFNAGLMKAAIPPLNALGMAYVGLTWPAAVVCSEPLLGCNMMPPESITNRMFTFDKVVNTPSG